MFQLEVKHLPICASLMSKNVPYGACKSEADLSDEACECV